jgi:hypothetical protein
MEDGAGAAIRPEDILAERGKSLVKETQSNEGRELSIEQVLLLLRKRVELGSGIPTHLESSPWRLAPAAHPKTVEINAVLEMSMAAQAGKIVGSGDFEEFIVSNSSLAVAGLVRYNNKLPYEGIDCHIKFVSHVF